MISAHCKFCNVTALVMLHDVHLNIAVPCAECALFSPTERAQQQQMRATRDAILQYFRFTGWRGDDEFNAFLYGTLDGLADEFGQQQFGNNQNYFNPGNDEPREWR